MSGTRVVLEGPGKFGYGASDLRAEWKRWKRGFNSWLIGAEQDGKKETVKVNLLLTMLGSEGQDICETFEFTEEQPSLVQVLERFDSHFAGLSNVTMTRFRFFSFVQGSASATDFVTSLKSLANDCEFGDLRDSLVKDMLVIHCASEKLRGRLLKESKLDLAKAVEIARIGEDAERNVEVINRVVDGGTAGALVVGKRGTYPRGGGVDPRRRWKFDGNCFECGELGHMAKGCPDREDDRKRQTHNRNCSGTSNDRDGNRKTYAGYAASWALGATLKGGSRGRWYVDSGASEHMTPDRSSFDWYEPYRKSRKVTLGDGSIVRAYGQGETTMTVHAAAGVALVSMKQVWYVPKLQSSLLSIPATTRMGNEVVFQRQRCVISCGSLRLVCPMNDGGLYEVPTLTEPWGAHEGPRSTTGCATSGGVKTKPAHQHVRQCERTDGYDHGKRSRMGSPGTRTTPGGASRSYDPPDTTSMARWRPRNQEHPDLWTKAGGQGYPGASTRNGPKAGGQGYPGASTRDGTNALSLRGVYVAYLIAGSGARLACNLVAFLYPAFQSVKALRTADKEDDTQWLTYWTVFGVFALLDFGSERIMSYFPLYWVFKIMFLVYLFQSEARGAQVIWERYLFPLCSSMNMFKGPTIEGTLRETPPVDDATARSQPIEEPGSQRSRGSRKGDREDVQGEGHGEEGYEYPQGEEPEWNPEGIYSGIDSNGIEWYKGKIDRGFPR